MSSRRSFLKAIGIVLASPSIVKKIAVKTQSYTPKYPVKYALSFKLTEELFNDKEAFNYFINHHIKQSKIDIDKPFNYEVGFMNDDFTKNILTCVISQYRSE